MTEPDSKPIGTALDALGVTARLADGEQITEVVVIAKIADFVEGDTCVGIYTSTGLDWIGQLGLLAAAQQVTNAGEITQAGDDD